MLVDEKPRNVIIHIDSNDITKMNYENVNAEYLTQRIVSISNKCRPFGGRQNCNFDHLHKKKREIQQNN